MKLSSINNQLPIAREGLPYAGSLLAFCLVSFLYGLIIPAVIFLLLGLFTVWFFRDPERIPPDIENAVLAPADGTIIEISRMSDDRFLGTEAIKISIFMSLFNVHVNRAPFTGKIEEVRYCSGKFISANHEKASIENEHNALILKTEKGSRIAFVQIAGLVARRIVCWVHKEESLIRGQRFGLIRFGSRLDVFLPVSAEIEIKIKDKVSAGQSILGYLK